MGIRAGLLKYPIAIYKPSYETNDYGQKKETYTLAYNTKARVLHTGGSRYSDGTKEVVYSSNKSFQIRRYVPVGEYDRVLWNNQYYRILSIDDNPDDNSKTINTELIND